jgi:hypothetical protein
VTIEQDFDSIELMETTQASFSHSLGENPMGEACKGNFPDIVENAMSFCHYGTQIEQESIRKNVQSCRNTVFECKWEI